MSACEPCWTEAYWLSRALGGEQVDHYFRLLEGECSQMAGEDASH